MQPGEGSSIDEPADDTPGGAACASELAQAAGPAGAAEEIEGRDLFEQMTESVGCYAPGGRILYVNPVTCRIFGRDREALVGKNLWELFPEAVDNLFYQAFQRVASTGRREHLDHHYEPWGHWYANELYFTRGRVVVIARDVTEERRAAEQLQLSETRYRLAALATGDAIWDWDLAAGTLSWGDALHRMLGYPPEALDPELSWWEERIHPRDRERVLHGLYAIVERGGDSWLDEYQFRHHDGHYVDILDRGHVLRDVHGQALRMVGAMQDVSDRKAREHLRSELEQQRRFIESIVEATADAIITIDEYCIIQSTNRATLRLFGYAPDELLGQNVKLLMPEPHRSEHDGYLERYRRTGVRHIIGTSLEGLGLRKDDSVFPLELTVNETWVDSGRIFVGVVRDISERKRAERDREERLAELARTVRFSELFVGILGHDLRNPLAGIVSAASLILRRADADKVSRPVARILNSAERMRRMIEQLLDFTRIRLGRGIPVERANVNLGEVGRLVVEELDAVEEQAAVSIEARGDLVGCWDRDRLLQLLSNLLGNALQHRVPGSSVFLRLDGTEADVVRIEVQNDGVIPAELLRDIFEPLATTVALRGRGASGLGLGLYISQQIVAAHGGTITVVSNAAEGTRFHVRLPRRVPEGPAGGPAGREDFLSRP